jgi:transposase
MQTWQWNNRREEAAKLVADDKLADEVIAAQVGITRQTLATWKTVPEFVKRVSEHREAWRQAIMTQGIADKVNRIRRLNTDWERMQQVIIERADDPRNQEIPGGKTGLLVKQLKGIGKGADFQIVEEFAVDAGLLSELRQTEQQAARELGQWTEKHDVDVRDSRIAESLDSKLAGLAARLGAASLPAKPDEGGA